MKQTLLLCLAAGCGLSSNDPTDSPVSPLVASGTYQLVNHVDLTVEVLLPEQAEQMVATLRAFSTNPAHALIDAADDAGVPAVGDLYDALPSLLTDRIDGWINDEIARVEIDGMPITAYAGNIAALADTTLTRFAIDSELTIQGSTASHRLTAIDLRPSGLEVRLALGGLAGDVLTENTSAAIGATSTLRLGEQHFGLAYGEYAWQAIEAASQARYGGDVRTLLAGAIDCPAIAHRVASKCVLGACVGHEAALTSICAGGLDAIVDFAHDRIAELRLEVLHLASGQATLVDGDGDGSAERITAGTWQAEIDLGLGLRHAPASFTGTR
jgi:hypothetical protein